jgi:hypothetical protein
MDTNGHITYRLINKNEWGKLLSILPDGFYLPDYNYSSAAVAEMGEEIVGVLFIQLALHTEPLIINDKRVNYQKLLKVLDDNLAPGTAYYAFAPNSTIGRMAELVGMEEQVGWRIFVKTKGA